ncbi:subtilisin-like protease SBT4.6 [Impatiens glandulifera]|uniref:subtilisin-like protease SBT4.6 n=1 Tax=Impatiens glandulifera TaxID=253017 RepID=UPI001FB19F2F|nr:subtilisin-like protease SBT4.6 [Impatiens glandulifera]
MEHRAQLYKDSEGQPIDATEYRRVIGCLRYLLHTRPDLSYVVGVVSRFMERPTEIHHKAVKQVLRYLQGTIHLGLVFRKGGGDEEIVGYSDSDLAGDLDDRKSTGGMAFYINDSLVSWNSQKQKTVALSSCEAEFMAAAAAACQALWLKSLLFELSGSKSKVVKLYVDNKSALALMKNPVFHGRSKHIDTKYHFIRECVEGSQIKVEFVRTDEQKADILTKALPASKLVMMRHLIDIPTKGVVSVFKRQQLQLQTTRSWDYIGLSLNVSRNPIIESDIIIGHFDGGVIPESHSFSDHGLSHVPTKWKGVCDGGKDFVCNRKIIGARGYDIYDKSARDNNNGHGTHTASTAVGRVLENTSFFGIANGTARGGVPSARIAVYKVCAAFCFNDYVLAAFDDAIADNVDIITISLNIKVRNLKLSSDAFSIGSFHAIEKGILTVHIAGNNGNFGFATTDSFAPWVFTVAAKSVGASGVVLRTNETSEYGPIVALPTAILNDSDFLDLTSYLNSKTVHLGRITKSEIVENNTPLIASYSSRGPNRIFPQILKPDITAPGTYILAAFLQSSNPSSTSDSKTFKTNYTFMTGTSMACPHVAGVVAYVKSKHPDWSFSAIKSSLMTSAWNMNSNYNLDNELGHGAGHVDPVKALNSGLVYETSIDNYFKMFCSLGSEGDKLIKMLKGKNKCTKGITTSSPKDLNYPTMTTSVHKNSNFTVTFLRVVTNVGNSNSTYYAETVTGDSMVHISVEPSILSFVNLKEKKSFLVTVSGKWLNQNHISCSLTWSDGTHRVRSPILLYESSLI